MSNLRVDQEGGALAPEGMERVIGRNLVEEQERRRVLASRFASSDNLWTKDPNVSDNTPKRVPKNKFAYHRQAARNPAASLAAVQDCRKACYVSWRAAVIHPLVDRF